MRRYVYIAFIVGLAMLVTGLALRADIAMPRDKWSQVRMVSEHVKITLSPASVAVEATFDLKNEKEAATVVVGYPRGILEKSLDDFKVTVDGEAVAVASQPGNSDGPRMKDPSRPEKDGAVKSDYQFVGPYPEWKTFSVKFDAAQTRKVVVSYRVAPAEVQGSDKGKLLAYIYTMKTGASWLGKIDKAVVECRLEGISMKDVVSVTPKPASANNVAAAAPLVWVFENFKPTQDIEITFKNGSS